MGAFLAVPLAKNSMWLCLSALRSCSQLEILENFSQGHVALSFGFKPFHVRDRCEPLIASLR